MAPLADDDEYDGVWTVEPDRSLDPILLNRYG
jgi:hypothetical protein